MYGFPGFPVLPLPHHTVHYKMPCIWDVLPVSRIPDSCTCLFRVSSSLFHFIHMRSPLKQYMRYLFHSCAKLTAYRLFFMFSKSFCLTICQFFYDVFPCQTFFYHQNHCMIQEIRNLIFDFFRIRILCCDHNFRCFFSNFFRILSIPLSNR